LYLRGVKEIGRKSKAGGGEPVDSHGVIISGNISQVKVEQFEN
jgi:hypothetical protein